MYMSPDKSDLDLELLAAYLDGRLTGEERTRAVKLLSESNEALEVFAEADRIQQDLKPRTHSIGWFQKRRWTVVVPLAAAAVLVIVALPMLNARRAPSQLDARALVAMLETQQGFGARLGAGWEHPAWSVTRGDASQRDSLGAPTGRVVAPPVLAFRLGVASTYLQVALSRADRPAAQRVTDSLIELMDGMNYADMVTASYRELRSRLAVDSLGELRDRASRAENELNGLLGSRFPLGKWAGAALLAARTGDRAFFASSVSRRIIDSAVAAGDLSPGDARALRADAAPATNDRAAELAVKDWIHRMGEQAVADSLRRP
jgi:hypothetical protein